MLFAPFLLWAQEESLADLQQRAKAGDGAAMLRLSKVYAEGELGVEPDLQTAHNYLIRATEAGDPYAYFELANHYDTDPWGILEPDEEQQRYWLERAAEQNHLVAIALLINYENTYEGQLGVFLRTIEVTPLAGTEDLANFAKDRIFRYLAQPQTLEGDTFDPSAPNATRALAWLRSEAEAGDARRQAQLGAVYWNTLNDKAKGHYWFLKAAEAGDIQAALILAQNVYGYENSPYNDHQEALKWLMRAAEGGRCRGPILVGSLLQPDGGGSLPGAEKRYYALHSVV